MKESIHLIGRLLGHVQMVEHFWLYNSNISTKIVQEPVFRQIRQTYKKEFQKT